MKWNHNINPIKIDIFSEYWVPGQIEVSCQNYKFKYKWGHSGGLRKDYGLRPLSCEF